MLISIDPNDPKPIYQQIVWAIKQQVCSRQIAPGQELPSVRELATALAVNLHTVRHAYQVLAAQGIVRLGLARRARVLPPAKEPISRQTAEQQLTPRLQEWIADALQLGLNEHDLRQMIDRAMSLMATRPE